MKNARVTIGLLSVGLLSLVACSSSNSDDEGQNGNGGTGGSGAGATNGGSDSGGAGGEQNQGGSGGTGTSGAGGSDTPIGGSGGQNPGGAGGDAGEAGSSGSGATGGTGGSPDDAGDTQPWRTLDVSADADQLTHGNAGLDPRAAKMMGKLVIDLGVTSGSYVPWLGKRGFHVMGISFPMCGISNDQGRDHNGDCRLNTFDGLPHGDESNVSESESMKERIRANLVSLHGTYPEEDWGYFLNEEGTEVRWSDVAFTGMSHGSSTAARIGRAVRLYRVVSLAGPRDNGCGNGPAQGEFDPNNPPWNTSCDEERISSWLDEESATPMSRFYSFVGMQDGQYGDIMFSTERQGYPGTPVRWDVEGTDLTSTGRFYADTGHLDVLKAANVPMGTEAALNVAFGVLPENQHPDF